MRRLLPLLLVALLLGSTTARADGFTPAQRAEIVQILRDALVHDPSILRDAVASLQADDDRRHAAAAASAIAQEKSALLADPADPVAGNPKGDVTIVEFYDTRCPYCRTMRPVVDKLLQSDPKLRLVFKDIPVLGPASVLEARALLAAQRQGGYLKLQAALMEAPPSATMDTVHQAAEQVGLDWARLSKDMDDKAIKQRLNANLALANKLGIQGTPAYVVGTEMIPGAVQLADLQAVVAEARKAADKTN